MSRKSLFFKLKKKLKNNKGFSFAELLLATLIMLLATNILTNAITLASAQYKKTVQATNAQLLCSTLSVYVQTELSNAVITLDGTAIKVRNDSDSSDTYNGAVVFSSEAHNFGPDAFFIIKNDSGSSPVNSDSNGVGFLHETSELYGVGRSYDIAGKGSYRGDLKAGMTLSFSDNSFEAHIWVVNEDGNKLAENYMRIIPLEIILLK